MNIRLQWVAVVCLTLAACSGPDVGAAVPSPGVSGVACQDDGSDAARIQAVIDASAPGTLIQIGGTCLLTRGIVLAGDRTYAGGSTTGTVLRQDGPMSFVLASSAYVDNATTTGDPLQIRDLTVACDRSGTTNGIVTLDWQADVQQVDVQGCGGSGVVDTSVTQNGTAISNTSVNSRFENNFISGSGRYGFEVQDPVNAVTDGYFTNNQVADSGEDGVYLENSAGWVITGNHLYSDGADGIDAARLYGTTISANYVEDFGAVRQSGTWYGIVGTAQGDLGSVIAGNKVFNDTGERPGASHIYIAVRAVTYGTGHLSVFDNVIKTVAATDRAFYLNGTPHALVVASAANQVSGPGTPRTLGGNVTLSTGI